ncbi:MAG: iron-dependent repressor [Cyclobacteriaceae bacterium]|nr:MAG: iron-dependent repressor [Cyclobacteriaceae bacterium]
MLSLVEENYLKAIYHLSEGGQAQVSTNAIADAIHTKPASVSDMIQKLDRKRVIQYTKYQGVKVTKEGKEAALKVIRKHRLWEVFLVEQLNFNWDEVHDVAEQLEHIKSPLLIERLDAFLGHPKVDPHGDPIPDAQGVINTKPQKPLHQLDLGAEAIIRAVKDSSPAFLRHLDKLGAYLGAGVKILEKEEFDNSMQIQIDQSTVVFISNEVGQNILVQEN